MRQSDKNYFSSVENLPVSIFYKIKNEKDVRYLIKDYDGEEVDGDILPKLKEVWAEINQDYTDALSNGKGVSDLRTIAQISEMEMEIMVVGSLISFYNKTPTEGVKEAILEWGYPTNVDKALDQLKKLKFKLDFLKSKNKELLEPEEGEQIEYDLYKDVVMLEQALGKNEIDPSRTVVAKWIKYLVVAQEKNKKVKENGK